MEKRVADVDFDMLHALWWAKNGIGHTYVKNSVE
jgi:hypothetical protein